MSCDSRRSLTSYSERREEGGGGRAVSWHPVRLSSWAGQAGPGQVAASFALLEIFCLISASNFIFHTIDADHTQVHTLISFHIV